MKHKKAKLIYYLNAANKQYSGSDLYITHVREMISILEAFGIYSTNGECCVWLYAANYPKSNMVKDFGVPISEVVIGTSGHYSSIKSNYNSANLVLIDRVAHINYFLENGKRSSFEAFQKHHYLFRKELYKADQNLKLWSYLDDLMSKSWEKLVCI